MGDPFFKVSEHVAQSHYQCQNSSQYKEREHVNKGLFDQSYHKSEFGEEAGVVQKTYPRHK
jgi:hypothetical protein